MNGNCVSEQGLHIQSGKWVSEQGLHNMQYDTMLFHKQNVGI